MKTRLKVALIGSGKMGRHHVSAINAIDNASLVAIADRDADALASIAEIASEAQLFDDVAQMLKEGKPDVVHIVTPPATHFDLAMQVLEAGASVYVEKPFALNVEDAEKVVRLADEKGLHVCAAHQLLFQRSARKYKEKQKLIGDVLSAESYFSFRPVRRSATGSGSVDPVDQFIDILPHPVYLLLDGLTIGGGDEQVQIQSIEATPYGDVHAILRCGDRIGLLVVTVRGRPVESYLKLIGTNGSVFADLILSGVTTLPGPGASAVSQILMPFSQAWQKMIGTLGSVFRIIFGRQGSYDGLRELIESYYESIASGSPPPISRASLLDTVRICEEIGWKVLGAQEQAEKEALRKLDAAAAKLPACDAQKGTILVTGGTGFLGKKFVRLARDSGYAVRNISRQIPKPSAMIPGIEYVQANLAEPIADELFEGVQAVVHLAAETAGGQAAHEMNSIQATANLIAGCTRNEVANLVNIGSVAVMVPSSVVGKPLDETAPVDSDNLGRGPYVWGKAKAEELVARADEAGEIKGKTIRLGPLVDFEDYTPPGRLGRELGNFFVAMGNPWDKLPICSVDTAAEVILHYVADFDSAPKLLNLIQPDAPKRSELWKRQKQSRPELTAIWLFKPFLIAISATLKLVLKVLKPGKDPIDVYAAFSSESYETSLARQVIADMERSKRA